MKTQWMRDSKTLELELNKAKVKSGIFLRQTLLVVYSPALQRSDWCLMIKWSWQIFIKTHTHIYIFLFTPHKETNTLVSAQKHACSTVLIGTQLWGWRRRRRLVEICDILQGQCKIKDPSCRASDHIFTKDTLWRTSLKKSRLALENILAAHYTHHINGLLLCRKIKPQSCNFFLLFVRLSALLFLAEHIVTIWSHCNRWCSPAILFFFSDQTKSFHFWDERTAI